MSKQKKPKQKLLRITMSEKDWDALNRAASAEIENLSYLHCEDPGVNDEDWNNYQDLLEYEKIKVIKVEKV